MSILFEPAHLAAVQLRNRFVQSATGENLATEQGEVTDDLVKRYRLLAKGEVGLIIPGMLHVHPVGKAYRYEAGIYCDDLIPGLKRVADAVHQEGGAVCFQLGHAGRQTTKKLAGQTPLGPSAKGRDPAHFVKPREMTEEDIRETIEAFGKAAGRAVEAQADGVQIHAAHGYLVNEFLSPFFNQRNDAWGGTDEKRFRFLKEIVLEMRRYLPEGMPLLIKLSTHDHTPQEGVTPALAARYAGWLAELGIDGIEVSCGTSLYSLLNVVRGEVPVDDFVEPVAWYMRPMARRVVKGWVGKYDLEEGYNLDAARTLRPVVDGVPLIVVGGLRRVPHMEQIVEAGYADFVAMCRPFIREPFLVKQFREGKTEVAACKSCNKCFAAVASARPVRCYSKESVA